MLKKTWCGLMIAFGWLSLALGFVGIFLPLLPTTPFVLLAAFFFSKGSKRLHRWLREHPRFGRYVRDWEEEQVIPPVGKYAGTIMMVPSVGYAVATRDIPPLLELLMLATLVAVLWFIWSRPSRRCAFAPEPLAALTGKNTEMAAGNAAADGVTEQPARAPTSTVSPPGTGADGGKGLRP
jgi:uncharacterized membrane protein YbaN (DUF454 family)